MLNTTRLLTLMQCSLRYSWPYEMHIWWPTQITRHGSYGSLQTRLSQMVFSTHSLININITDCSNTTQKKHFHWHVKREFCWDWAQEPEQQAICGYYPEKNKIKNNRTKTPLFAVTDFPQTSPDLRHSGFPASPSVWLNSLVCCHGIILAWTRSRGHCGPDHRAQMEWSSYSQPVLGCTRSVNSPRCCVSHGTTIGRTGTVTNADHSPAGNGAPARIWSGVWS